MSVSGKSNYLDYQFALAVGGFSSMIGTLSQSPLFVGIVTSLVALVVRHYLEKAARSAPNEELAQKLKDAELRGFTLGCEFQRLYHLRQHEENKTDESARYDER